jgi:hypothetical protein
MHAEDNRLLVHVGIMLRIVFQLIHFHALSLPRTLTHKLAASCAAGIVEHVDEYGKQLVHVGWMSCIT